MEDQCYNGIEMIAGGQLVVGTNPSDTVCLFNLDASRINTAESGIKIEKDIDDGEYIITFHSYKTKYKSFSSNKDCKL